MPSLVPLIGVSACRAARANGLPEHRAGAKYAAAISDAAGGLPVLIPPLAEKLDLESLIERLDGLLLTGSPSNVEPHHYAGGPEPLNNLTDPSRDATVLPLVQLCLARGVPLLAVCRGHQELNVALGGSLHQEVHKELGRFDHRSDKTVPHSERYALRHPIDLVENGYLAELFGAARIQVNSLHGQAIDRVAPGLIVEAVAEDGTIEAVRVADAPTFAVGVQWHPEWEPLGNPQSSLLFKAFGEAAAARARLRQSDGLAPAQ